MDFETTSTIPALPLAIGMLLAVGMLPASFLVVRIVEKSMLRVGQQVETSLRALSGPRV